LDEPELTQDECLATEPPCNPALRTAQPCTAAAVHGVLRANC